MGKECSEMVVHNNVSSKRQQLTKTILFSNLVNIFYCHVVHILSLDVN